MLMKQIEPKHSTFCPCDSQHCFAWDARTHRQPATALQVQCLQPTAFSLARMRGKPCLSHIAIFDTLSIGGILGRYRRSDKQRRHCTRSFSFFGDRMRPMHSAWNHNPQKWLRSASGTSVSSLTTPHWIHRSLLSVGHQAHVLPSHIHACNRGR